jgi:hypothetical protein
MPNFLENKNFSKITSIKSTFSAKFEIELKIPIFHVLSSLYGKDCCKRSLAALEGG